MQKLLHLIEYVSLGLVLLALRQVIRLHFAGLKQSTRAVRFRWFAGQPVNKTNPNHTKESNTMFEVQLTTEQKVLVTLAPETLSGQPAELDGIPKIAVISGDATIEIVDDKNFFIVSGSKPGDSQVLVEADADLGEGVELISGVIKATVIGARAANLGLKIGTPVLKSATPPAPPAPQPEPTATEVQAATPAPEVAPDGTATVTA